MMFHLRLFSQAIKFALLLSIFGSAVVATTLHAHNGEVHDDDGITLEALNSDNKSTTKLPINVGGPFSLINHHGEPVTHESYAGRYMLVFFGYTNCQIMCSTSLARIGAALALLEQDNPAVLKQLSPLVVTVDRQSDTPDKLKQSLEAIHPALIGLTGTAENLDNMYAAYKQSPKELSQPINGNRVVSHGSFFHLMGPDGELKTFFPPILNVESMANILKKYIQS